MLFDLGRYREAVEAFTAELGAESHCPHALSMRASSWLNSGHVWHANRDVHEALRADPNLAYAHYVLSCVRCSQGYSTAAERSIRESIRLAPRVGSYCLLADIYFKRNRLNECLRVLDEGLRLDPFDAQSLILRSKALSACGRHTEARECLRTVLAYNPENPAAHHALGSITLQSGEASQARDSLREARRLNPVAHNDRDALAAAYGRLLQPLRVFDRYLIRYYSWTPSRRWMLLAGMATLLLVAVHLLEPYKLLLVPLFLLAFNLVAAPASFDMISVAAGKIVFRRDLDLAWYQLLPQAINVVFPILMHVGASFVAVVCAYVPPIALMFIGFAPNIELIVLLIRKSSVVDMLGMGSIAFLFVFTPLGVAMAFSIDSSMFPVVMICWGLSLLFSYLLSVYRR